MSSSLQLALPLGAPRDIAERLRSLGLPDALVVTVHENARVMVSLDPGRGLRVHRGYGWAPDPVLAAIVQWAKPRVARTDRRHAARAFLAFPVHDYVPRPPTRRRVEPRDPRDDARLERLQLLHLELNQRWFDGRLGPIAIRLSGRMRRKLGHYEPRCEGPPAIVIGRRHINRDGWHFVERTLLHEMVHQWQDENGLPVDHGRGFRSKAIAVGIEPRAVAWL